MSFYTENRLDENGNPIHSQMEQNVVMITTPIQLVKEDEAPKTEDPKKADATHAYLYFRPAY